SFKNYVESIHTGTSIPHISQGQIADFEILAPSYEEQKAIASVLSSLDNKIDLLLRQNQTLEAMAETLFRQWFIEEAEESWEKGKIGDLFTLQRGFDLPSQNRTLGKYPIISASGLNGYHEEYKIKAPGVTTGRSGLIGKVFYVWDDFWPLNTSLFVSKFKIGTPVFTYFLLKTLDLEVLNAGSAVPSLNRNDVHSIDTKIPTQDKIKKYEDYVKPLFTKLNDNHTQIQTITQLRDTLLPKLMSGEVRVSEKK
ncbi:MAG: restriction endonuclease subunit S, partial [Pedobacter sp.]|nr:restriction endonuclease subunit S [Pedobacter sp.]